MSSIEQSIKSGTLLLSPTSESARLDAEILLAYTLKKSRTWLYTWPETLLKPEEETAFNALIHQRQTGFPIAYLTGQREFWSFNLKVTPDTLIPRPETEMLPEIVLNLLKDRKNAHILDAGTGTGAIALVLAKERPDWDITACDKSFAALEIAKENARNHQLEKIHFYQSDWFSNLPQKKYHAIVSNPPYIRDNDPHLREGDVRFEPQTALVSAEEGYSDIQHLIEKGSEYLLEGGLILLEHGYDQREKIASILYKTGYKDLEFWQDVQGQNRIIKGIWYS